MPTAFVLINTEIGSESDVLKELKKVEGVDESVESQPTPGRQGRQHQQRQHLDEVLVDDQVVPLGARVLLARRRSGRRKRRWCSDSRRSARSPGRSWGCWR